MGCRRPDGAEYRTLPDVFVYRRPIDVNRGSLALALDGPPALIFEVLSESTYSWDLDLERGKGYSYARAGVREYMTIDPSGALLPEGIRAWRLADGTYQQWQPEGGRRWRSEEIGISVSLEGAMATVHDAKGRRQLREGEIARELACKDAELAELRRLLEAARGK
ncbi:MAG TPA: Uma2 family endonuclease [Chloroflexota bacterium]|nr:Uma2 family endonuclease [Chloroflexota bacterium]